MNGIIGLLFVEPKWVKIFSGSERERERERGGQEEERRRSRMVTALLSFDL